MIKRIDSLDILKAFAIFMVVWGHVIQHCLSTAYYEEPVYKIIYSFHMPLFMILAGFFSHNSLKLPIRELALKKIKELIVPCITWGGVIYSLFVIFNLITRNANLFSFIGFAKVLVNDYWFLKSLFICYLIAWFTLKLKYSWLIVVSLLVSQLLNVYNIPIMYPCFIVGFYLRMVIDRLQFIKYSIFYLLFFLPLLFYAFCRKNFFDIATESNLINNGTLVSILNLFQHRIVKIIMGVSGSLFLISIMRRYYWQVSEKDNPIIHFICKIGRKSLGIYLVHTLLVSSIMAKIVKFDNINPLLFNAIISPLISIVIIMVCMMVILVLEKNKVVRFFFLGH